MYLTQEDVVAMSCSTSAPNTLLRQLDMELVSLKRQVEDVQGVPAVLPPAGPVGSHAASSSGAECQADEQRTEARAGSQSGRVQAARGRTPVCCSAAGAALLGQAGWKRGQGSSKSSDSAVADWHYRHLLFRSGQ